MSKTAMMRILTLTLAIAACSCASAGATVSQPGTWITVVSDFQVCFEPNPVNLYDLAHGEYYTWGIDYTLGQNMFVDSASLTFANINNWQTEDNDILYVNLLQSAASGVYRGTDNQAAGNFFQGMGDLLLTYSDLDESTPETFTYSFTPSQLISLNTAIADNNFGLGFDPDCHYFNSGIKLTLNTKVVPEPISCILFLAGGSALLVKRRLL